MLIIDNEFAPSEKQPGAAPVQTQYADAPPPYVEPKDPVTRHGPASAPIPTPVPASVPLFRPTQQQCVNHLSLFSRHDAISGTYLIEPRLPPVPLHPEYDRGESRRQRSVDKTHARNVRVAFGSIPGWSDDSDVSDKGSWFRRSARSPEVNAAFRTRHGHIKVDIGIVNSALQHAGSSTEANRKARGRVMLSSRHGRIHVNLTEIQPGRCADLDVSTRHGNIMVFLPANFDGSIAFRSRRGPKGIAFLPAFAARARIVRGTDREMLVNVSTPNQDTPVAIASQPGDDYSVIGTRHGKIVIGIYGLDQESDAIKSGGLAAQLEALVESGTKQLETWIQAGTKALENSLQAKLVAAENARRSRSAALEQRVNAGRLLLAPDAKM